MNPISRLEEQLRNLDGKDYGAYQSLIGAWAYPHFELHIDRIPKDPYAPPGIGVYRARVPSGEAGFPPSATSSQFRRTALEDFLARSFLRQCAALNKGRRGTGHSGVITIAEPGPAFLERTSMAAGDDFIEARFSLALPAQGRAISGTVAINMLLEELPRIVRASLFADRIDPDSLEEHLGCAEDGAVLRERLASHGLVAFVADGALLPRKSGVETTPLAASAAVPFRSPESLRVRIDLPNAGSISGMGISKGVTLIVGGGYHGKSTLLQALQLGIYSHIPGDGRERCASLPGTVKVRAASGRSIANTDISAFIGAIPRGRKNASTSSADFSNAGFSSTDFSSAEFSTSNASGSTSQAAFIAEAIEAGAEVLLMDEDTCASNFMIRDRRMRELVAREHEPITPFVERVRELYERHGISTILVMGGSGDYFKVADCVVQMKEFVPLDVTEQAHDIDARFAAERTPESKASFERPRTFPPLDFPTRLFPRRRFPLKEGIDPHNEYGRLRIAASGPRRLTFGKAEIDLSDVEQLAEAAQTRAIGRAILHAVRYMDGKHDLREIARRVEEDIRNQGLQLLDPALTGDLANFRGLEFAAVLNRLRSLKVKQE